MSKTLLEVIKLLGRMTPREAEKLATKLLSEMTPQEVVWLLLKDSSGVYSVYAKYFEKFQVQALVIAVNTELNEFQKIFQIPEGALALKVRELTEKKIAFALRQDEEEKVKKLSEASDAKILGNLAF